MEYLIWDDVRRGFIESVGCTGVIVTPNPGAAFSFPNGRAARDVFDNVVDEGYLLAVRDYKFKEEEAKTGIDKWLKEAKEKWSRGESMRTASSGTSRTRRASRST